MDIPRYTCNENIRHDFLHFLKEANEAKSDIYCNFQKYDQLINLLPLHDEFKRDLTSYMENANICIDITQSDEEMEHYKFDHLHDKDDDHDMCDKISSILSNSLHNLEQTNIDDITDSIKDSLCLQNEVSSNIIKDLSNLGSDDLDKVFSSLANQLNLENVENFWDSLMNTTIKNDYIILCYVRFLFVPRVKQEFTYKLEAVFLSLSQKYAIVTNSELVKALLTIELADKESNRVLEQYIGTLENDFKTDVLRHFIYTCEQLYPSYLSVAEALLNPQTDYDILSKIIEVMSNAVTDFTNDNAYGKLLFNVVNLLERNVCRLEQPLKHILGIHRSIWKIKVQKVVVTWFDDSLTQSFV